MNQPLQYEVTQGPGDVFYVGTKAHPFAHSVMGIDAALTLVSQLMERDTCPGWQQASGANSDGPADSNRAPNVREDGK